MTITSMKRMARAYVTAVALLLSALPSVAWSQQIPVPAAEAQAKPAKHSADWAEMRIAKLHADLHITAAQEAAWTDVASAMRDNAKSMKALIDQWAKQAAQMSALDNLRMHGEMAEEHAKGMRRLIPVFDKLYNMMPDAQKKIADGVFARQEGRRHHKGK